MENANPAVVVLVLFFLFFVLFLPLSVLVLYVCSIILMSPMILIHVIYEKLFSGPSGINRKTRITKKSFIAWADKKRLIKERRLWKIGKDGKKELTNHNKPLERGKYIYQWIIVVPRCPPDRISLNIAGILEKVRRKDVGKNIKDVFLFASKQMLINSKPVAVKLSDLSYSPFRTKIIFTLETEQFVMP